LEEINAIKNVTKGINVYGMSWMSFGDDQSKALQKHLTHVFEESGILAIAKAYIENHFPELKMDLLP
jgi:acyl-[acyl carrier protein]--UDP-N-acetylglucosamine O-acyltransferase